eukprot:c57282_g1_i1 orf=8-157(-)
MSKILIQGTSLKYEDPLGHLESSHGITPQLSFIFYSFRGIFHSINKYIF